MAEKYALLVLQFVLGVGMTSDALRATFNFDTNYGEDWTDWSFSKAPEPCFDLGAERSADLNDLKAGVKSQKELIEKEGRQEDDVIREISIGAQKRADAILAFQKANPELAQFAPQFFGLQEPPAVPVKQ
jgi:capsid protein